MELGDEEELFETQPVQASQDSQSESQVEASAIKKAWGHLLPYANFPKIELVEDSYTFGRDRQCTVNFTADMLKENKHWHSISKTHFSIKLDKDQRCAILEDLSSNGTFIDNERLKCTPRRIVLQTNNVISIAHKSLKAYIYIDLMADTQDFGYPKEVTDAYKVCKQLGRGASGEVRLAFQHGTCRRVALKVINKRSTGSKGINTPKTVQNEIKIMESLNHPCVTEVIEVMDFPMQTFIVMDYLEGGTLANKLHRTQSLPEETTKLICYQLFLAVEYLHSNGIVHRDLKPENILLQSNEPQTLVKVSDFGLSKFIHQGLPVTLCGSRGYLAPEVLTGGGKEAYTPQCDIWSMGVILHECLVGSRPIDSEADDMSCYYSFLKRPDFLNSSKWKNVSPEARTIVKSMLVLNPEKRATVKQLLNSHWFDDSIKTKAHQLINPQQGIISTHTSDEECDSVITGQTTSNEPCAAKKPRLELITPESSAEGEAGSTRMNS